MSKLEAAKECCSLPWGDYFPITALPENSDIYSKGKKLNPLPHGVIYEIEFDNLGRVEAYVGHGKDSVWHRLAMHLDHSKEAETDRDRKLGRPADTIHRRMRAAISAGTALRVRTLSPDAWISLPGGVVTMNAGPPATKKYRLMLFEAAALVQETLSRPAVHFLNAV